LPDAEVIPAEVIVDPAVIPAEVVVEPTVVLDEEYEIEIADDSPLSQEDLDAIATYAHENGLTKEAADKLVLIKEAAVKKSTQSVRDEYTTKGQADYAAMMLDPIFEASAQQGTYDSISLAVETFGGPELHALLSKPGFGDQLPVAQFLKKIGDLLKPAEEGGHGKGTPIVPDGQGEKTVLEKLYPDFYK